MQLSTNLQGIGPAKPVLAGRKRRCDETIRNLPRLIASVLVGFGGCLLPLRLAAFEYFPFGAGQALKWGNNAVGTPGGIVTWSLMPDGTTIDPSFVDPNFSGTSSLSSVFNQIGGPAVAMPLIQKAFDAWSAAANIQFVQVPDNGAAFNSSAAVPPATGQIRVGAFAIAGYVGAVGYAPPPNGGTTLEGDVLFNLNAFFQVAAGNEGDLIDYHPPPDYFFHNDFQGLFTHELGHATGLAHPPDGVQAVMSADPAIYARVNRQLDPDDIAGIQFLYGAAPTPPQRTYHYQGRVLSGGVPFNGSGLFKFALMNGDGTQTYWQNAPDTSPADGQPDSAVAAPVSGGLYSVRLGDTGLMAPINPFMLGHPDVRLRVWFDDGSHGFQLLSPDRPLGNQSYGGALVPNPFRFEQQGRVSISGVPFTGTGQFKFALVNQDGSTTYWRSAVDASPADGEPDAGFNVPVTRGLYSVLLGDSSLMLPMDPTAPAHPDVRLRTWFNDGVHGFQKLTPDRRLGRAALGKAPADPFLLGFQGRIAVGGVPFTGTGQFKFALVNGNQVYWTSSVDNAPADGIPDVAVSLTVTQGQYSILLGDGSPTLPIAPEVMANADVFVRVWFSDGIHGSQLLAPDQRLSNPISFGP